MKAQTKRHIQSGFKYDALIPKSTGKDAVIVGSGNAGLEDTLNLMKMVIVETLQDSQRLAATLKGATVTDTCRNIWNFVYRHIQYAMDKTGVEQVRRPSRSWADRATGVDCDCYTVFIGSILTNLNIPFKMRITKYGGKHHFQHVYPIVPTTKGHITLDCVTDQFNYEVPYSEKKDIVPDRKRIEMEHVSGLSGVDTADISLDALEQKSIPLWEVHPSKKPKTLFPIVPIKKQPLAVKSGMTASPFRFEEKHGTDTPRKKKEFNLLNFLIIAGISVSAGIGVLKLLSRTSTGSTRVTGSTRGISKTRGKKKNTNRTKKKRTTK